MGISLSKCRALERLAAHTQLLPVLESGEETTLIGGQAVMEGVMMRAPHSYCVAVRKPNGEIVTETKPIEKLSEKNRLWKLPMLRGLATLGQAMVLGIKSLQFSANVQLEAEQEAKGEAVLDLVSVLSTLVGRLRRLTKVREAHEAALDGERPRLAAGGGHGDDEVPGSHRRGLLRDVIPGVGRAAYASGINDAGYTAMMIDVSGGAGVHAVARRGPAGDWTIAEGTGYSSGINHDGELTGSIHTGVASNLEAFRWNGGAVERLGTLGGPLAGGNAIVMKAAEQTPTTLAILCYLVQRAIADELGPTRAQRLAGVFQVVHGRGETVGKLALEEGDYDKVMFTGGTETGGLVGEIAGRRRKPVSLELGGHAAIVLLDDFDLDRAVAASQAPHLKHRRSPAWPCALPCPCRGRLR